MRSPLVLSLLLTTLCRDLRVSSMKQVDLTGAELNEKTFQQVAQQHAWHHRGAERTITSSSIQQPVTDISSSAEGRQTAGPPGYVASYDRSRNVTADKSSRKKYTSKEIPQALEQRQKHYIDKSKYRIKIAETPTFSKKQSTVVTSVKTPRLPTVESNFAGSERLKRLRLSVLQRKNRRERYMKRQLNIDKDDRSNDQTSLSTRHRRPLLRGAESRTVPVFLTSSTSPQSVSGAEHKWRLPYYEGEHSQDTYQRVGRAAVETRSSTVPRQSRTEDEQRLKHVVPGIAGVDYPVMYRLDHIDFSCANKSAGYYSDSSTRCQAYHICARSLRIGSFLCPNGTLFNQQLMVCDWWFNTQCLNEHQKQNGHRESRFFMFEDDWVDDYFDEDYINENDAPIVPDFSTEQWQIENSIPTQTPEVRDDPKRSRSNERQVKSAEYLLRGPYSALPDDITTLDTTNSKTLLYLTNELYEARRNKPLRPIDQGLLSSEPKTDQSTAHSGAQRPSTKLGIKTVSDASEQLSSLDRQRTALANRLRWLVPTVPTVATTETTAGNVNHPSIGVAKKGISRRKTDGGEEKVHLRKIPSRSTRWRTESQSMFGTEESEENGKQQQSQEVAANDWFMNWWNAPVTTRHTARLKSRSDLEGRRNEIPSKGLTRTFFHNTQAPQQDQYKHTVYTEKTKEKVQFSEENELTISEERSRSVPKPSRLSQLANIRRPKSWTCWPYCERVAKVKIGKNKIAKNAIGRGFERVRMTSEMGHATSTPPIHSRARDRPSDNFWHGDFEQQRRMSRTLQRLTEKELKVGDAKRGVAQPQPSDILTAIARWRKQWSSNLSTNTVQEA